MKLQGYFTGHDPLQVGLECQVFWQLGKEAETIATQTSFPLSQNYPKQENSDHC
jgi:murein endopeptidase